MDSKIVLLHGFNHEEALAIMKAVKVTMDNSADLAFAMTTSSSLTWTVQDLMDHLKEEHRGHGQPPGRKARSPELNQDQDQES